jgi:hypothetical protein
MKPQPYHWSPRCGARSKRNGGKPCVQPAMANGKCQIHGGKSLSGRAHPAFKTGRRSRAADADRAEAKAMRKRAEIQYREDIVFGLPWKMANAILQAAFDEADAVALRWMDKFHARDARGEFIWQPPRRRPPKRPNRPLFPNGYLNTLGGGRFTKQAKAQRAAERDAMVMALAQRAAARTASRRFAGRLGRENFRRPIRNDVEL